MWQRGEEIYKVQTNTNCFIFNKHFFSVAVFFLVDGVHLVYWEKNILSDLKIILTYTFFY